MYKVVMKESKYEHLIRCNLPPLFLLHIFQTLNNRNFSLFK